MPFNGTGTFVRLENWTNDAAANLPISASKFDTEANDWASGFGLCLTRDGQGAPTGPLAWAQALTLSRASDGAPLTISRTGGTNNPSATFVLNDSANTLAIAVNGTTALAFAAGSALFGAGTAALPSVSFTGDPDTGFFHVAANDVGVSVNGVQVEDWQATQITAFNSPITGGSTFAFVNTSAVAGDSVRAQWTANATSFAIYAANAATSAAIITGGPTGAQAVLRTLGNYPIVFGANNIYAGQIDGGGRWTFAAPQTGGQTNFTFQGRNGNNVASFSQAAGAGTAYGVVVQAGTTSADYALLVQTQAGGTNDLLRVSGTGEVFMQPPTVANVGANGTFQVGYLDSPQNLQNVNYGLVLTDRGKCVTHSSGTPHTWTIPANGSIAFPIGTTIMLVVENAAAAITLNITTDSLVWAPSGTVGSGRTLTGPCIATLYKYASAVWLLSGVGIS